MSRRALATAAAVALVATASAGMAGCSSTDHRPRREGTPVFLGNLEYSVQISRFLNPKDAEDKAYLEGRPTAAARRQLPRRLPQGAQPRLDPRGPADALRGHRYRAQRRTCRSSSTTTSRCRSAATSVPAAGSPTPRRSRRNGPIEGLMVLFLDPHPLGREPPADVQDPGRRQRRTRPRRAGPLSPFPPELSESGGGLRLAMIVAAVAAVIVALDLFSTWLRVACLAVLAGVLVVTSRRAPARGQRLVGHHGRRARRLGRRRPAGAGGRDRRRDRRRHRLRADPRRRDARLPARGDSALAAEAGFQHRAHDRRRDRAAVAVRVEDHRRDRELRLRRRGRRR